MKKLLASVAVLAMLVLCASAVSSAADDKEVPSIKAIMKKANAGKNSLVAKITADVKGEKWDDAAPKAKELFELGQALTKNKCPKGDEASWEKLSKAYCVATKELSEAVEKKDGKAAGKALKTIGGSCGSCHKVHK